VDQRAGRLWHGDRPVELRPKAWALLRYLAERPVALVTKEELHADVWGDVLVSGDTLTQTLGELRRVLPGRSASAARHRDRSPPGGSLHRPLTSSILARPREQLVDRREPQAAARLQMLDASRGGPESGVGLRTELHDQRLRIRERRRGLDPAWDGVSAPL
jgi:Transcriptional regulatory protein, C terminal